jgi:hypothetical protein
LCFLLSAFCLLPSAFFAQSDAAIGIVDTGTQTLAGATVSFSPQPAPAVQAVTGVPRSGITGLQLWEATVCHAGASHLDLDSGRVLQAAQTRLATVNPALAAAIVRHARRRSPWRRAAAIAEWAALGYSALVVGGTIKVSEGMAVIGPIINGAAHRIRDEFDEEFRAQGGDDWRDKFLTGMLTLPPRGCVTRLLFARPHKAEPFEQRIEP